MAYDREVMSKHGKHVSVTDVIAGPFTIVVTDPACPGDDAYPITLGPYETKAAALQFIDRFRTRATPYMGLHFAVANHMSESGLVVFCSWED